MPVEGSEESLFLRLKKAQVGCSINGEQKFLPLDTLEKEITEENIGATLTKPSLFDSSLKLLLRTLGVLSDDQLPRKTVKQGRKIFAILVNIGEPNAIGKLLADGLMDEHLPLRPGNDGTNALISPDGRIFDSFATSMCEQRVSDFVDRQWTVMAPVLDASGRHTDLDRRVPLPFQDTEVAGHGAASTVHKSRLHPAHRNGSEMYGNTGYVAAKEFWNGGAFRQELENLKTLAKLSHPYLIRHLATYTRDTVHFVIFPWADGGCLRDFWVREDGRGRDQELTMWSLRQMLGIAEAVEALHNVNCRHGDLKPENILHFRGLDEGRLVVADVGVSKTHDKGTKFRHIGTTTRATTPNYEAPEAFTHHSTPRSRRYDVWSLGCIFLEFALWLLHDMESIVSFGYARHAPDFEFYLINRDSSASNRRPAIHPMVTKALERLRQDPRCKGGTVFETFLNLIEERLLRVDVEKRASADDLVRGLREIVRAAEINPARLFNHVAYPPDKLRFPKRAQTGAFEPANGTIVEHGSERLDYGNITASL